MSDNDYKYGEYKLWYGKEHGATYSRWVIHQYRIKNGITEIREKKPAGRIQNDWEVGKIPEGARLIN